MEQNAELIDDSDNGNKGSIETDSGGPGVQQEVSELDNASGNALSAIAQGSPFNSTYADAATLISTAEMAQDCGSALSIFLNRVPDSSTEITALISQCFSTSSAMRHLDTIFHESKVRKRWIALAEHVETLKECLRFTFDDALRLIDAVSDDLVVSEFSYSQAWINIEHHFKKESNNTLTRRLELSQEFIEVLSSIINMGFPQDVDRFEDLRRKFERLLVVQENEHGLRRKAPNISNDHWLPSLWKRLPAGTLFSARLARSQCFAAHMEGVAARLAEDYQTLLELPLENGNMIVQLYHRLHDSKARIFIRTLAPGSAVKDCCLPLARSMIERNNSRLVLKRVDKSGQADEDWAVLQFRSYEKLVLFFCMFIALRAQDCTRVRPILDYMIQDEEQLFRGIITDDKYRHGLQVFQDKDTKVARLQASVLTGEMK
ncbi:hypothetical protein MMC21_008111, partial [Puttea exsequens]|nr:hypothetical protein [Puttea exsequens]